MNEDIPAPGDLQMHGSDYSTDGDDAGQASDQEDN